MLRVVLILTAALLLAPLSGASEPPTDDIEVRIDRRGGLFIIDVDLPLAVSADDAWPVITDYDHMAEFISNITYSRIMSRDGNRLRVEQKGRAGHGLLSMSFENVRDVELIPPVEIRTHLVSGNLEEADSITRLVDRADGCHLVNHGEYVPTLWVPLAIGRSFMESQARVQFGQLRAEIMRRKARVASSR
jgi:hypothetical protein